MKLHWAIICQLLFLNVFISHVSLAQANETSKYFIEFEDKQPHSFDPYTYFDINAIERRITNNYPLFHISDWPITEAYINEIQNITDSVSSYSRWLNGISVIATPSKMSIIQTLPFVKSINRLQSKVLLTEVQKEEIVDSMSYDMLSDINKIIYSGLSSENQELLTNQTERMGGQHFAERNIDGSGIRIAIFDAGFPSVNTHFAFSHIRKDNRIIKTRDFVKKKEHVYKFSSHGTSVLSCIAGMIDEKKIGLATGAEFLLARTENGIFEPYSEEENWLAAAEWADKNGAHIINSSLGYTHNRYFPNEMNGKKSLVSRAANIAASKGILVVNAAGNDGDNEWKTVGTPADADSVLSIGGTDPNSDYHIDFSSFGPTADHRLKPNVCAYGLAIVATPGNKKFSDYNSNGEIINGQKVGTITTAYGTSFSSPLVTGFAACAWQSRPTMTNMEMFREIEKSGDLYPYFDYAHGYGVPQAVHFIKSLKKNKKPTFRITFSNDLIIIKIDKKTWNSTTESTPNNLYYHIENNNKILRKYLVISVSQKNVLELSKSDFTKGSTLRIHYKGYTDEYNF